MCILDRAQDEDNSFMKKARTLPVHPELTNDSQRVHFSFEPQLSTANVNCNETTGTSYSSTDNRDLKDKLLIVQG